MKRKSHKDSTTSNIDVMKPIPFDKLGNENDPCFGKHHLPTASECSSCGDSEICSIVCAQKLHSKRGKIESTQPFKDISPDAQSSHTWKTVSKACKKVLKKRNDLDLKFLSVKVMSKLQMDQDTFTKFFQKVLGKSKYISMKKNIVTYKK